MHWNDVRVFLAVAESGSLSAAARRLKLSQPTVGRRVRALERTLGLPLFDRRPDGFALTAAGAGVLPVAADMARAADAMERQRPAMEGSLAGVVRIAAGGWMSRFLGAHAPDLTVGLPGLEIEIFNAYQFANLARREADLALRNRRPEGGKLAVRRLPHPLYAVYGHRRYVEDNPKARTEARFRACRWIGFDETNAHLPTARWLASRLQHSPALRCTQSVNILDGIKGGFGLGIIPCFVGDEESDLVRLGGPIADDRSQLWLVIHEDLRRAPRVRAVVDRVVDLFDRHRHTLAPGPRRA
ncbi:MAG TPA: LysR family transcriptional regulator [Methylomirabilota bacterium]|nr:LysR family transcriptional regulator [Methylomirabilota bacterium]